MGRIVGERDSVCLTRQPGIAPLHLQIDDFELRLTV